MVVEQLYTVEIFVESIKFLEDHMDKIPKARQFSVGVEVGDIVKAEIRTDLFASLDKPDKVSEQTSGEYKLNCGKMVMFSSEPSHMMEQLKMGPFRFDIFQSGQLLAYAEEPWKEEFFNLVKIEKLSDQIKHVSASMDGNYDLMEDLTVNVIGHVQARVRLSFYGSTIESNFKVMDADDITTKGKQYLFKNESGDDFQCDKGEAVPPPKAEAPNLFPLCPILNSTLSIETMKGPYSNYKISFTALSTGPTLSTTPEEFQTMSPGAATPASGLSYGTFDILSIIERQPKDKKALDLHVKASSVGFSFTLNDAEMEQRNILMDGVCPEEELTVENIERKLCTNKDCPAHQKFKQFGIGPLASSKGVGRALSVVPPCAYGLSNECERLENFGPEGLFSRPKRPDDPFVHKRETLEDFHARCWKPKQRESGGHRLRGGGIDYEKTYNPLAECQNIMSQFDDVLQKYKQALGPCGKPTCPFVPNITNETCKTACKKKKEVVMENLPEVEQQPWEHTPKSIRGACGSTKCPFTKYRQGVAVEDDAEELQHLPMARAGLCGQPTCPVPYEQPLPPIHWDCPDPLPKGRCTNPNCPYLPDDLKNIRKEMIKSFVERERPPPCPPPAPKPPLYEINCGNPACPALAQQQDTCDNPKCPFAPQHQNCPSPACPYNQKPPRELCQNPQCPLAQQQQDICNNPECPVAHQNCPDPACPYNAAKKPKLCQNPQCPLAQQQQQQDTCDNPKCPYAKPSQQICPNPSCPYAAKIQKKPSPCFIAEPCRYNAELQMPQACTTMPPCPLENPCCPFGPPSAPMGFKLLFQPPNCNQQGPGKIVMCYASPSNACQAAYQQPVCGYQQPQAVSGSGYQQTNRERKTSDGGGNGKGSGKLNKHQYREGENDAGRKDTDGIEYSSDTRIFPLDSSPCTRRTCMGKSKGRLECDECGRGNQMDKQNTMLCYPTPMPCGHPQGTGHQSKLSFKANAAGGGVRRSSKSINSLSRRDSNSIMSLHNKHYRENIDEDETPQEKGMIEYSSDTRINRLDSAPCTKKTCKSKQGGGKLVCDECNKKGGELGAVSEEEGRTVCTDETCPNRREASLQLEAPRKHRKIKGKYVYSLGNRYPKLQPTHRMCIRSGKPVPAGMGWLWNLPSLGMKKRKGWRPGMLGKTMAAVIQKHREKQGFKFQAPVIWRKGKPRGLGVYAAESAESIHVEPRPTLQIKKKDGAYFVTMNPLKDPYTLVPNEDPYMNCTPIQFKITKKPEAKKSCFCGEEGEEMAAPPGEDESSSSDSELDIEFTPPAGLIHPEKFHILADVVHTDTQYLPADFATVDDKKKDKKDKKDKKGKKDQKGKGGKGNKKKK